MSRRKQLKPQALRKDEKFGHDISCNSHTVFGNEPATSSLGLEDARVKFQNFSSDNSGGDVSLKIHNNLDYVMEDDDEDEERDSRNQQITLSKESQTCRNGQHQTGPFTFACTYCTACFETYSQVKNHEQEHAHLMPYRCTYCQKGFKHKRSVDRHVKLHSGVRKHKCTVCRTAFFRSDHLKLHMKTHESSKYPYSCSTCHKGFYSTSGLQNHQCSGPTQDSLNEFRNDGSIEALPLGSDEDGVRDQQALVSPLQSTKPDIVVNVSDFSSSFNMADENKFLRPINIDEDSLASKDDLTSEKSDNHSPVLRRPPTCISCTVCGVMFNDVDSLQSHTSMKHALTDLHDRCSYSNPDAAALPASHKNSANSFANELASSLAFPNSTTTDPLYPCNLCPRIFDSILTLHSHVAFAHESSESENQQQQLQQKPQQRAPGDACSETHLQLYQRNQCDFSAQTFKSFTGHMHKHLQIAQGGRYCSPNQQTQYTKAPAGYHRHHRLLADNEKIISKREALFCDVCHLYFFDLGSLAHHLTGHYIRNETQYACSACGLANEREIAPTRQQMDSIFNTEQHLYSHLMEFHAKVLYKCTICQATFDVRQDLQLHYMQTHTAVACKFRCRACNALFQSRDQFQTHVRVVHGPGAGTTNGFLSRSSQNLPLDCNSPQFPSQRRILPNSDMFSCPICFESFSVEYLFDKHMEVMHEKPQDDLNQQFINDPSDQHDRRTSANYDSPSQFYSSNFTVHKCQICDEKFPDSRRLFDHKLMQHCKVLKSEKCNVCRLAIRDSDTFFQHMNMHNNIKSNISNNRNENSSESALQLNDDRSFCENVQTGMVCVICKQTLASSQEVRIHAEFHCGQSSKDCSNVEVQDAVDGNQSKNIIKPLAESPGSNINNSQLENICHFCSITLDSPSKLQRHLMEHQILNFGMDRSHATITIDDDQQQQQLPVDFRCFLCDEIFPDASTLQAHLSSRHENETKPFKCHVCDESFFFQLELQNHNLSIHTKASNNIQLGNNHIHLASHLNNEKPAILPTQVDNVGDNQMVNSVVDNSNHPFKSDPNSNLIHVLRTKNNLCIDKNSSAHFSNDESAKHSRSVDSFTDFAGLINTSAHSSAQLHSCQWCGMNFTSKITLKSHVAQCKRTRRSKRLAEPIGNDGVKYQPDNGQNTHNGCGKTNRSILVQLMSSTRHPASLVPVMKLEPTKFLSPRSTCRDSNCGQFQCPHCPKSFVSMSALQGHSHVHMHTIKAHRCEKCKKTFQTAAKLRNHQRQHNGDKPFMCHLCNRYFSRKDNLKVHLKTHLKHMSNNQLQHSQNLYSNPLGLSSNVSLTLNSISPNRPPLVNHFKEEPWLLEDNITCNGGVRNAE